MKKTELKYSDAVKRLNEIGEEIEGQEVDIDTLADKRKEAKKRLKQCKDKLYEVDKSIQKVLSGTITCVLIQNAK